MDSSTDILGRFTASLKDMPGGRKIALFLAGAIILSSFIVMILWSNQEDYQMLFSNLSPEDASKIIERLKEQKIPYKISGAGTVVQVPTRLLYEARLDLASQRLPRGGGVGFEIFDRSKIGTTEFVQRINYRRALQGELARTISQFQEIETARVHLVIPKRSLFVSDKEKARASVMVRVKSGSRMSKKQVEGIVYLVASSVESLDPSDVTLVDTRGEVLSGPSGTQDLASISNSQLEYRQSIEKNLAKRIESMLEKVVGIGKVIARVSATVDFRQVEKTEERYDPENQAIRSEQSSEEIFEGSSLKAEGVPGVMSNIPGSGTAGLSRDTKDFSKKKNETINYEVSLIKSRIVEPTGSIQRLSVAVLLDGSYVKSADTEGKESPVYKPRSPEEMKIYENIVKGAIGFDPDRGDKVEVQNIPFEKVGLEDEMMEPDMGFNLREYMPLIKQVGTGLLFLFFLLFVVRPFLRSLRSLRTPELPAQIPGGPGLGAPGSELSEGTAPIALEIPKGKEEDLVNMAKNQPEQFAGLMRNWLQSS